MMLRRPRRDRRGRRRRVQCASAARRGPGHARTSAAGRTTEEVGAAVATRRARPLQQVISSSSEPRLRFRPRRKARPQPATRRMTGAEAVIRSLEAEGVDDVFGHPRRRHPAALRRLGARRALDPALSWCGTSRAPATWRRATRARPARSASPSRTSGPGATNLVTPIADAYLDSTPIVVHHRPGADAPDRHRRLPGGRHPRHHHADRRSTPGWSTASDDIPRVLQGGVPHRPHRPARPGAGRHPQGPRS